jgi:hypothetical protein
MTQPQSAEGLAGASLESLYSVAASLAAKAYFAPSWMTPAEHMQLAGLRLEIRDVFGVVAP